MDPGRSAHPSRCVRQLDERARASCASATATTSTTRRLRVLLLCLLLPWLPVLVVDVVYRRSSRSLDRSCCSSCHCPQNEAEAGIFVGSYVDQSSPYFTFHSRLLSSYSNLFFFSPYLGSYVSCYGSCIGQSRSAVGKAKLLLHR